MCRDLSMSKPSTASLKKLLKISAHVSGLLIISLPSESIILLFLGVLSEKKDFTCVQNFLLSDMKLGFKCSEKLFLILLTRDTQWFLCFLYTSLDSIVLDLRYTGTHVIRILEGREICSNYMIIRIIGVSIHDREI